MPSATLEDVVTRIGVAVEKLTESQQETDRTLKELAGDAGHRYYRP